MAGGLLADSSLRFLGLLAEYLLCFLATLLDGLAMVSLKVVAPCSLEAALVTVPIRDDLLDTAEGFWVAVLHLRLPILTSYD